TPVLLREALDLLSPQPGDTVVDATVGLGGHATAILEQIGTPGRLIGVDRDPAALALAWERLDAQGRQLSWSLPFPFSLQRADFRELPALLGRLGAGPVDGLLLDLGVSSLQLDREDRGFSF